MKSDPKYLSYTYSKNKHKRYEGMIKSYNHDFKTPHTQTLREFVAKRVPHKNGSKKPDAS